MKDRDIERKKKREGRRIEDADLITDSVTESG